MPEYGRIGRSELNQTLNNELNNINDTISHIGRIRVYINRDHRTLDIDTSIRNLWYNGSNLFDITYNSAMGNISINLASPATDINFYYNRNDMPSINTSKINLWHNFKNDITYQYNTNNSTWEALIYTKSGKDQFNHEILNILEHISGGFRYYEGPVPPIDFDLDGMDITNLWYDGTSLHVYSTSYLNDATWTAYTPYQTSLIDYQARDTAPLILDMDSERTKVHIWKNMINGLAYIYNFKLGKWICQLYTKVGKQQLDSNLLNNVNHIGELRFYTGTTAPLTADLDISITNLWYDGTTAHKFNRLTQLWESYDASNIKYYEKATEPGILTADLTKINLWKNTTNGLLYTYNYFSKVWLAQIYAKISKDQLEQDIQEALNSADSAANIFAQNTFPTITDTSKINILYKIDEGITYIYTNYGSGNTYTWKPQITEKIYAQTTFPTITNLKITNILYKIDEGITYIYTNGGSGNTYTWKPQGAVYK